jgi:hypothetical protein
LCSLTPDARGLAAASVERLKPPLANTAVVNVRSLTTPALSPRSHHYTSSHEENVKDVVPELASTKKNSAAPYGADDGTPRQRMSASVQAASRSGTGSLTGGKTFVQDAELLSVRNWNALLLSQKNKNNENVFDLSADNERERDVVMHKDITFGDKIGEGSFGEVWSAYLWGQHVAVKTMHVDVMNDSKKCGDFLNESRWRRHHTEQNVPVQLQDATFGAPVNALLTRVRATHKSYNQLLCTAHLHHS